jgi:hypothetical protein
MAAPSRFTTIANATYRVPPSSDCPWASRTTNAHRAGGDKGRPIPSGMEKRFGGEEDLATLERL